MEEILLLSIGFNLEMRRLSRILRSNLELPDDSVVKSDSPSSLQTYHFWLWVNPWIKLLY